MDYLKEFFRQPREDLGGITYQETFYQPMLELIDYLEANQFTVYIVSGSEQGVVWAAQDTVLDMPRAQGIGGLFGIGTKEEQDVFTPDQNLIREADYERYNAETDKVYNIYRQAGKVPIFSAGNSSGDYSMLNYALSNDDYQGFALMVKHDDTEREYAYGNADDVQNMADQYGWHVASMKDEFKTVFTNQA